MKKVFLILVAGAFISVSSMSCNKCGECSNSGAAVCEKDNKTAYDLAKAACENGGGTWETN
jgi:hypothetical protein